MVQVHITENIVAPKLQATKKKQQKTIAWGIQMHFAPEGMSWK